MDDWPALPYDDWLDTRDTLHMYTQVVGKIRLALSPFEPEWANVPLYVTARGLTTSPVPDGLRAFFTELFTAVPDQKFEVLESVPNKRLVMTWGDAVAAADKVKRSRVAIDIETVGEMVRLTVTHDELSPQMRRDITNGWPRVLSSLKSFLETGRPLNTWA